MILHAERRRAGDNLSWSTPFAGNQAVNFSGKVPSPIACIKHQLSEQLAHIRELDARQSVHRWRAQASKTPPVEQPNRMRDATVKGSGSGKPPNSRGAQRSIVRTIKTAETTTAATRTVSMATTDRRAKRRFSASRERHQISSGEGKGEAFNSSQTANFSKY